MKTEITFRLNGIERSLFVEPNDVLIDVLRTRLGIKSPKIGCDQGDCGTCTVFFNGKTVRSCLVLAIEADGGEIVTLEGLSENGPTPLQRAFADRNAFQCGFCAPGIILSATELLQKNPEPDRHEIQEAIAGNLCRCTGYTPVIDVIAEVAAKKTAGKNRKSR
ncbi:MAG: (2Fe-2S)-binding protein [Elusimicrobiaceae bacterium]|nr:(2Fe-2S)-binding protein [Elusimicrobiaceae bacterium]